MIRAEAVNAGAGMLSLCDFLSSGEHPLVAAFMAIQLIPAPGWPPRSTCEAICVRTKDSPVAFPFTY